MSFPFSIKFYLILCKDRKAYLFFTISIELFAIIFTYCFNIIQNIICQLFPLLKLQGHTLRRYRKRCHSALYHGMILRHMPYREIEADRI